MTRFAISLALIAAGCGLQNPSETFQVDSRFSPEQREELQRAAAEVCERTEGRFCPLLLDSQQTNKIRYVDEFSKPADDGATTRGHTDTHRGLTEARTIIRLDGIMHVEKFHIVLRHELGHAGGCNRHLAPWNVMSDDLIYQPRDWTDRDIACIDGDYDD